MFILLAFFVTATGAVSSTSTEFNTADSCEAAKNTVYASVPVANKIMVCVPK